MCRVPWPRRPATPVAALVLLAYTAASIAAGLGAVAWTTLTVPILPGIDPGLAGTVFGGSVGGTLLWIAFGLLGSLRILPVPGSLAVWTFHLPFIAAAMTLGGPTAGAWVAFLSTIELRELESQPWYGVLANHSVMALAAVAGGLTVQAAHAALSNIGADPGLTGLVTTGLGTVVLAVIADGVAAGTIVLREHLSPLSVLEILLKSLGPITLAEIGLAWVFVALFTTTGWWAPIVVAGLVLLVWPHEGVEFIDPLMKLPRMRTFQRELDGVLARTRRGLARGGLLLALDLDGFGQVNKDLGQHVGDEVLAEIGERLRGLIRSTDLAGRLGGDELAMFYVGAVDLPTARRLAARVETAIRRPIATSAGDVQVGVSIGAIIIRPAAEIPSRATLMQWADGEMQAAKQARKAGQADPGIRFHPYGSATWTPASD